MNIMVKTFYILIVFLLPAFTSYAQKNIDWVRITEHAQWQPRDSQGELVYKGRMWIFGGWFDSYKPAPRDVWSSSDGADWVLVEREAPWKHSDLAMTVVFKDKMWIMGGWYNGRMEGHSAGNAVWYSGDGANWEQVTKSAAWSPRLAAGLVVFKGKMWILGGIEDYYFGDEKDLKNDVWCSSDGKDWEPVTAHAGWSPRAYHQAIVFDDKIWIMGGGNYVPEHKAYNDVWCSEDGVHWEEVTSSAAWDPRLWFSAVVYRDRMFILGGWSKAHDNFGDVWYSKDGLNWKKLNSDVIWKSRHEHSTWVFRDRIWVAGGFPRPLLSNEVWSLEIPKGWFDEN